MFSDEGNSSRYRDSCLYANLILPLENTRPRVAAQPFSRETRHRQLDSFPDHFPRRPNREPT